MTASGVCHVLVPVPHGRNRGEHLCARQRRREMSHPSGYGDPSIRQDGNRVSPSKVPHGLGLNPLAGSPVEEFRGVHAPTVYIVAAQKNRRPRIGVRGRH